MLLTYLKVENHNIQILENSKLRLKMFGSTRVRWTLATFHNKALHCLRKEGQVLVFEDLPIQFLLGSAVIEDYRTKEWYKVVLRRLSPLFSYCHELLLKENFNKKIIEDETLAWLTHPNLVYDAVNLLPSRDDKCVGHEVILSLTPMLERSLGNLLYTWNSNLKIPSLLRDLTNTKELHDIIGSPMFMLILHVLLGTPQ